MNDIIDHLSSANPFPNAVSQAEIYAVPSQTADELFADITRLTVLDGDSPAATSTTSDSTLEPFNAPPTRGLVRRHVFGIAAAVAAALLMTMAVLFAGPGASSAQAALTKAAQAAAGFDSGQADVEIIGSGLPGQLPPVNATSTYTYNGDDYRFVETGIRSDGGEYRFELRRIEDRIYWASPGSPGAFVHGPVDDFAFFDELEATFSFNPKAVGVDALVQVFEAADDVTEQHDGTMSIFTATISRDALAQLDRTEMPPGLTLITGPLARELPDEVALQAVVDEGMLSRLEITIGGEAAEGPVNARITTTLSGLGVTAAISAPADTDLLDVPLMEAIDELEAMGVGEQALLEQARIQAIMDDVRARRPRLCIEFGTAMFEGPVEPEDMAILIGEHEALASCYRDAGESAMAGVIDGFAEEWRVGLASALALDELEARRPDLCVEHLFWDSDEDAQEGWRSSQTNYIDCLTEAGETRAAEAVQAELDATPFILPADE